MLSLSRVVVTSESTPDVIFVPFYDLLRHGPLARYVKLRVTHGPGMPSLPPRVSDPDMYHGTCVTHALWCMSGSQTSGVLPSRWRGKHTTRNFMYLVWGPCLGFKRNTRSIWSESMAIRWLMGKWIFNKSLWYGMFRGEPLWHLLDYV